jgi:hypothetical protein
MRSLSVIIQFAVVCGGFWIAVPVQGQSPYRNGWNPMYWREL